MRELSVCLSLLLLAAAPVLAAPAALETCRTCHDEDGSGVGRDYVPIIAGIPAAHIEEALYAYKNGARTCVVEPVMCDAVAILTDGDIEELAAHYGALERYSHATTFNENRAARGAEIHDRLCGRCHLPPDDPDVADAPGIPLHGQRADYLQYALESYLNGKRKNLLPEMEEKIKALAPGDVRALVDYYISY